MASFPCMHIRDDEDDGDSYSEDDVSCSSSEFKAVPCCSIRCNTNDCIAFEVIGQS